MQQIECVWQDKRRQVSDVMLDLENNYSSGIIETKIRFEKVLARNKGENLRAVRTDNS